MDSPLRSDGAGVTSVLSLTAQNQEAVRGRLGQRTNQRFQHQQRLPNHSFSQAAVLAGHKGLFWSVGWDSMCQSKNIKHADPVVLCP